MSFLLILIVAIVGIGIVSAIVRARRPEGAAPSGAVPRLVRIGALIGAAVTGVVGLIALGTIAVGGPITTTIPVRGFLPTISPELDDVIGPEATITGGPGFTQAELTIDGLDVAARLWLAAGTLIHTAVIVTILLLIARLARQAGEAAPFERSTSTMLGRGGALLAVGGLLWQICFAVAGVLAANQALFVTGYATDDPEVLERNEQLGLDPTGLPSGGGDITIDFWPVGIGLVLIVVATLMRQGERLQRDTAGLV